MFYTGIGSRRAPEDILKYMQEIAARLVVIGYVLRSGGADGADMAFEQGCDSANGPKEIYVPWRGFNKNTSLLTPKKPHYEKAATIHPAWRNLTDPVKALHARNVCQVTGMDLQTNSDFVICWTPDGAETVEQTGKSTGGTGTAIRLADTLGIRVYNLAKPNSTKELEERLAALETARVIR